jgi:hypothetical protein
VHLTHPAGTDDHQSQRTVIGCGAHAVTKLDGSSPSGVTACQVPVAHERSQAAWKLT